MKSLGVYMSLRGNLDWIPRRHSMFSGAYATAADTDQQCNNENPNRYKLHTFQMILIGHSLTKNFYLSLCVCSFPCGLCGTIETVINDKSKTIGLHCALMRRKWSKIRIKIYHDHLLSQCYTYKSLFFYVSFFFASISFISLEFSSFVTTSQIIHI